MSKSKKDYTDDPEIFAIQFTEIDYIVYLRRLPISDLHKVPFDGSMPATDMDTAQERVLWVLNNCVYNLEEVKDQIKSQFSDPKISAAMVLILYQGCVAINPALDMLSWHFMIRKNGLYNEFLNAAKLNTPSATDILKNAIEQKIFGDIDCIIDEEFGMMDFVPPPWAPPPSMPAKPKKQKAGDDDRQPNKFDKKKILTLKKTLNEQLIGQSEAIEVIDKTLRRSIAGLKDEKRPLGVFLFAGSSGVGKTLSAKVIQKHLFGENTNVVRIDCAEFQQKHESMKLIGSPNSYVGFEEGGQLTNAIKQAQNTVLLLDEAEKAHPDFWSVFLKVFDEGYLTDNHGDDISFENTIIIMTSNIGNDKIAQSAFAKSAGFTANIVDAYESGEPPKRSFVESETKAAINRYFKPEFVNRIDEIVIFNYLDKEDLEKVSSLELQKVAEKMVKQGYRFRWSKPVEKVLADKSIKAIQGARSMAKIRRNEIEDLIAEIILTKSPEKGTMFFLSVKKNRKDDTHSFVITTESGKPVSTEIEKVQNERNRAI